MVVIVLFLNSLTVLLTVMFATVTRVNPRDAVEGDDVITLVMCLGMIEL